MTTKPIPIIDLFAGPGGLGEGFSAYRPEKDRAFQIALSIEKEATEHETLKLRAFFRQFEPDGVPDEYYDLLRNCDRGEADKASLFGKYPRQYEQAEREAYHETLGKDTAAKVRKRIGQALEGIGNRPLVLIGGPPCQAYSLAGRSRNKGIKGYIPKEDKRQYLYREYLQILADYQPAVFVMENVKGLLSAKLDGESIFKMILSDLEHPAKAIRDVGRYTKGKSSDQYEIRSLVVKGGGSHFPQDFVVQAEDYGIPQKRHRLILLGVRKDFASRPSGILHKVDQVPIEDVIDDLPRLRSGLSKTPDSAELWAQQIKQTVSSRWFSDVRTHHPEAAQKILTVLDHFHMPQHDRGAEFLETGSRIKHEREWYQWDHDRLKGVCNHCTRSHIVSDLHRYLFASSYAFANPKSPELCHFPSGLLPNHKNVAKSAESVCFADRFRVQRKGAPSTTVVSHISKDGHYYIHYDPSQCRSLTVREAARLQTFPDNYLFWGNRTRQYHQVGNAVPPLLANKIARIVHDLLG